MLAKVYDGYELEQAEEKGYREGYEKGRSDVTFPDFTGYKWARAGLYGGGTLCILDAIFHSGSSPELWIGIGEITIPAAYDFFKWVFK